MTDYATGRLVASVSLGTNEKTCRVASIPEVGIKQNEQKSSLGRFRGTNSGTLEAESRCEAKENRAALSGDRRGWEVRRGTIRYCQASEKEKRMTVEMLASPEWTRRG